jgi:hypothetical protein
MAMAIVRSMTKQPGHCFVCGTTPTENGLPKPSVDLNLDYDWGNNAYICIECANLIATLIDRPTPEEITKTAKENTTLKRKNKELTEKLLGQEDDLSKIRQGGAALKKVKASG